MDHAAAGAPALVNSRVTLQQGVVWVLFLFSGICALIYEVLWCRHLGLLFGNTVESMSAVLTAFMGGLALGSYVGGRVCHRLKRPMLVYGVLEIAIGVYCAFLPWAFGADSPIIPFYRKLYSESGDSAALSVTRFAVSFFLLLIPTTFMGATLPVLAQFLVRSKAFLGRTVGALYAVNTAGAVLGASLTGFVLLPVLGKANSNYIAVVANLVLGSLAVILGMREESSLNAMPERETPLSEPQPESSLPDNGGGGQPPVSPLAMKLAIATFGITGFAAMATQIGWTRAITLAIGSSTYAFSLIVAVFIMGLSLGGVWGARAAAKTPDPLALLGKLLLAIGVVSMALTAILEFGPRIFLFLTVWGSTRSWTWQLTFQAFGIGLLIIGPTFLMGATMPLTMQVAARSAGTAGRTVGTIYAVNTIGSILGSFFGGLLLLPLLHIQGTLQFMALLYVAPGLVLFLMSKSGRTRKPPGDFIIVVVAALTALGVFAGSRSWDRLTMTSGMYLLRNKQLLDAVHEGRWADAFLIDLSKDKEGQIRNRIIYYNEGAAATVAVNEVTHADERPPELSLTVGGKPDASSHGDMSTQLGLALVPALIHEKGPESVLVIGLGSGASAYAALAPESVKSVDVVEMSPEVVEASYYFAPYTHLTYKLRPGTTDRYWLDTPRLNLIVNDGRNHLLLTSRKYDVIASEPSNPWLAGVGNLFTKESFELCRQHLHPRGIMCQWIHCYSLEEDDFYSIVKTFTDVFPHVQLWCVNRLDFLLIGSDAPPQLSLAALRERMKQPRVLPLLKTIHFDSEEEFLACFMSTDSELRALAAKKKAELHTDDNMRLEFSAPKALYHTKQQLRSTEFESDPEYIATLRDFDAAQRGPVEARLDLAAAARVHTRCVFDRAGPEADHWLAARLLAPNQLWVVQNKKLIDALALQKLGSTSPARVAPPYLAKAQELAERGEVEKAIAELQAAAAKLTAEGKPAFDCVELAVDILRKQGRVDDALGTADSILRDKELGESPQSARLWELKAEIMQKQSAIVRDKGRAEAFAFEWARNAKKLSAQAGKPSNIVGWTLLRQKKIGQALDEFHALTLAFPGDMDAKLGHADVLLAIGTDPEGSKTNPDVALKKLRHARRVAREAAALRDDPAAWVRLADAQLLLALQDKPSAAHHTREALETWEKVIELDKAGLLRGLRPEMSSAEAMTKAGFGTVVWKIGDTYKMDPDAFIRLHAAIMNLKAH